MMEALGLFTLLRAAAVRARVARLTPNGDRRLL
jgi:hypothetical protein